MAAWLLVRCLPLPRLRRGRGRCAPRSPAQNPHGSLFQPDRQFVFAGDGGYGTHALARFAARRRRRNLTLVSLFHPNAALHDLPPVVVGKKNGRGPQEGEEAARPRGGRGRDRVERPTGGVLVRRRPSHRRGGQRDGPLAQVGEGVGRGALGVRPRPDRDPPRLVPLQHRPDDAGGPGDRDLYRSLEYRDDLPRDAGVSRPGDDAGPDQEHGVAAAPCLFGLYSVVALLYAELPAETTAEATVSYRGKAVVTFSDAISAVRRQLWLEGVFESHGQTEAFRNLPRPLQAVLLAALAPAA